MAFSSLLIAGSFVVSAIIEGGGRKRKRKNIFEEEKDEKKNNTLTLRNLKELNPESVLKVSNIIYNSNNPNSCFYEKFKNKLELTNEDFKETMNMIYNNESPFPENREVNCYVMFDQDTIIGTFKLGTLRNDSSTTELFNVCISKQFQGRKDANGIKYSKHLRRLIVDLLDKLDQHCILEVDKDNDLFDLLVYIYTGMGFKTIKDSKDKIVMKRLKKRRTRRRR